MILEHPLIGKHIQLRTALPADAEFALSLRLDEKLGRFIKNTDPSVEKQRSWIRAKIQVNGDYHMVIESLSGRQLGIIALYDINDDVFDWGRWIIDRSAPFTTSAESMLLLYSFAFNSLNLTAAEFEVRKGNTKVISFHPTYGAEVRGEDENFIYYRFTKQQFHQADNRMLKRWKKTLLAGGK